VSRILLVDDNAINSGLAQALLEYQGHQVIQAASAAELRARLVTGITADVVVLDVLLPDGLGASLVAEVHAALPGVLLLALTAQSMAADRDRFLAAGFDDVIHKPIDPRHFTAEIAAVLRKP
jgi:DNA-binding response OmpR family regulator